MNHTLCHHGILGQKWGVRRYQNEDGSLTNAGKDRYGIGTIQKGSTVRRVSGVKKSTNYDNPAGLYAYTPEDALTYTTHAKLLPSVNPTYGSNAKKAKVTQYEFVKDAKIVEGEKAIDDYMKRYGQITIDEYRQTYTPTYYAHEVVDAYSKKYAGQKIYDIYKNTNESKAGQAFVHDYLHNTIYSSLSFIDENNHNGFSTKVIDDFVNNYKKQGIDAIVDPEDYSAGFKDPLLILNKDVVKETGSYKFRIK